MKKFILIFLPFLLSSTNGNKIKIQIDSEDIVKLVNGIMRSSAFRHVAAEMVRRAQVTREITTYNNPYHPEDDNMDGSIEMEIDENQKKISTPRRNRKRTLLDSKLENDNDNYILDGHKNEDELENTQVGQSTTSTDHPKRNPRMGDNENLKKSDTFNSKMFQKRFLLKNS